MEYETLNLEEVKLVLQGKSLVRPINVGETLKGEAEKLGQGMGAIVEGI